MSTKRKHTKTGTIDSSPKHEEAGKASVPPPPPSTTADRGKDSTANKGKTGGNAVLEGGAVSAGGVGIPGTRGRSSQHDKGRDESTCGSGATSFACWVCRRGFKSARALAHHEAKSELHLINVQLREFLSP